MSCRQSRFWVFLTVLLVAALAEANTSTAEATRINPKNLKVDILYIDQRVKDQLDLHIRPIRNRVERAVALHRLLFDRYRWHIDYAADKTYTAQETFDNREGNCVSLANLFIAAARYVGLPAKFQQVKIPEEWSSEDDYYVLTGHINTIVKLGADTVNVEFLETFFDINVVPIDKKVISDNHAFAEYHNNIAMQLMSEEKFDLAKTHLDIALEYFPKHDAAWSNYGVLKKFQKKFEQAEEKYLAALRFNKGYMPALSNLHVLYTEQERFSEASRIAKRVDRFNRKNPYFLAKLAEQEFEKNRTDDALTLINKAIRRAKNTPIFYHKKANYLYASGEVDAAIKALEKARGLSVKLENSKDIALYQRKIEALLSSVQ